MSEGNSHLGLGIAVGAILGAAATYLIIRNQDMIKEGIENIAEKVKDKVAEVRDNAKEKVHSAAVKVEEKTRK